MILGDGMHSESVKMEGSNGGSYIDISDAAEKGVVHLEVGETCVCTVDQEIGVAALAQILTWAKDYGFQKILDEYQANGGGSPSLRLNGKVKS